MTKISCWVVLDEKREVVSVGFGRYGAQGPMTALSYYAGSRTARPFDEVGLLREGYRVVKGVLGVDSGAGATVGSPRYSDDDVVYLCPDCGVLSSYYTVKSRAGFDSATGKDGVMGVDWWLGCVGAGCGAVPLEKIGYTNAVLMIEGGHSKFS